METHRRLAPCPAALEDRELGPSTGKEVKIEDREEWVEIMGGVGSFGHLAAVQVGHEAQVASHT